MVHYLTYAMVYLGAALMVYNIIGFIKYARQMQSRAEGKKQIVILYVPIILLFLFLLGYLLIGFFGHPDWLVGSILFGGSVFVLVVYLLLSSITESILKNEQLEVELKAAEESNRKKTEFLATISHEMRTPMNVILGLTGIALKNPSNPGETRDQLEKIQRSGHHLLGLINNILEIQAFETGNLQTKREPFSLPDALAEIGVLVEGQCEEKALTYRTEIQSGLPQRLLGDELLLKQALLDLLDNAVKFTDAPGEITLAAEQVSAEGGRCALRFRVRDTGVGMTPEFLSKAFDLFAQEDGSFTNRFGGSGLGLASVKNKIALMGGQISVESEKNAGSVFTVTVPFDICEAPKETASSQDISLAGRRVLIVEDVDENAEIAADLLELEEVESERAENGQAALDMFRDSSPGYYDAVLMDLRMPVMDGLESARCIRAMSRPDARTIPIIALTANAFETDVQHSLEAGMNAHLVKPVDADLLYATLKEWIGKTQKEATGEANQ